HAVRKNVAARHWAVLFTEEAGADPWERLFDAARRARPADATDLVPYWVYSDGRRGAAIERHVLAYALSRDLVHLRALQKSLAVYPLAFGQPRQHDLLEYLLTAIPEAQRRQLVSDLRIDLSPRPVAIA